MVTGLESQVNSCLVPFFVKSFSPNSSSLFWPLDRIVWTDIYCWMVLPRATVWQSMGGLFYDVIGKPSLPLATDGP
jgi:hypothetical protein